MRRTFQQIFTISLLGALLFALQLFAFTEPSSSPPTSNVAAPLNVGSSGQSKFGGLVLNTGGAQYGLIVDQGNVGVGTQSPSQKLDVAGYIKAQTGLCLGSDCRTGWTDIPGGFVGFFNLSGCPSGWSEFTNAQGRYVVGLNPGGTIGGTSGTALSNLEDRPTGRHRHHGNVYPDHGSGGINGVGIVPGSGVTEQRNWFTGINENRPSEVGTINDPPLGTNAPYVQLLTCVKN